MPMNPNIQKIIQRGIANQSALPVDTYERAVGLNFLGFVLLHEGQLVAARAALTSSKRW